jgi:hypothetical protein
MGAPYRIVLTSTNLAVIPAADTPLLAFKFRLGLTINEPLFRRIHEAVLKRLRAILFALELVDQAAMFSGIQSLSFLLEPASCGLHWDGICMPLGTLRASRNCCRKLSISFVGVKNKLRRLSPGGYHGDTLRS